MRYDPQAWDNGPKGFMLKDGETWTVDAISDETIKTALALQPQSIIDVGCIDGRFCGELRRRGFAGPYVGVDITKAFIDGARKRYPNERFEVGDIRGLDTEDREHDDKPFEADLVICSNVLQHVPDLNLAMRELCRIARRCLVITVYASAGESKAEHSGAFLNYWFSDQAIQDAVPKDAWSIKDCKEMVPTWDRSRLLRIYVLERKLVAAGTEVNKDGVTTNQPNVAVYSEGPGKPTIETGKDMRPLANPKLKPKK